MKELFVVEKDDRKLRAADFVTWLAALALLLTFAGCSPEKPMEVNQSQPWAAVRFQVDQSSRYPPSFAIWIEDAETGDTATLYATKKVAENRWIGAAERPGTLPVWSWAHKGDIGAADTVGSVTPGGGQVAIDVQIPDRFAGRDVVFYIEANVSYDYNEYYRKDLQPGDEGFCDVNGQPSVLWAATADTAASPAGSVSPALVGHGDVLGAGGDTHTDMTLVTTAASLLKNIQIDYDMDGQ